MSQNNKICMELVFTKTSNDSVATKINDFWKLIDSQDEIKPYKVENELNVHTSSKNTNSGSVCMSKIERILEDPERTSNRTCKKVEKEERFWHNELKLFKSLGLDKIALSTCKNKKVNGFKKYNENLIMSDMVEESYEEIKTDLEDFEKRLKDKESK